MRGLEVKVNGERVCTAGMEERGVLTAHVTWLHRHADAEFRSNEEGIKLHVGGLASDTVAPGEHRRWIDRPLQLGDVVEIRVLEIDEVDEPSERKPEDPELPERYMRRFYEKLKWRFGDRGTPACPARPRRKRRG